MRFKILIFWLLATSLHAQKVNKYWVAFTDKNDSPYCLCRPAEFLSARSLERRDKAGIALDFTDLPVNPAYVKAVQTPGVRLHHTSRWLNAAAVIADADAIEAVRQLPFVQSVTYLGPDLKIKNPPVRRVKNRVKNPILPHAEERYGPTGYARLNEMQLRADALREAGATGKDIWVAVMDGGFINVDSLVFFDSIGLQGRLWPGPDFVERDRSLYEASSHGTSVLSVMAANVPNYFVGLAPHATYFLLKTEDTGGEFPIEEANWIAGAEWADSIGVDVINASLGYTVFNDTTLGHRYRELDGRTALGSRGATIAAKKGMLICNSAGNSGDEPWRYVGVPADAPGIIAVGATLLTEPARAPFSSVGPTADGRIKPDLMAPGDQVVTADIRGTELGLSSGTSLASPLLAGALASLWSAFPEKPGREILDAVMRSADQFAKPDNNRGYGLPDFAKAWLTLHGFSGDGSNGAGPNGLFAADRDLDWLKIIPFRTTFATNDAYSITDWSGRTVRSGTVTVRGNTLQVALIEGIATLPSGYYTVFIRDQAFWACW